MFDKINRISYPVKLLLLIIPILIFGFLYSLLVREDKGVVVSCASSLKDAMYEIQEMYQAENKEKKVVLNFGATGALQMQIENGAKVDIFISASQLQMDILEKKDMLVNSSRIDLLGNALALVTSSSNGDLKSIDGLLDSSIRTVAIGEPSSVPAGKYAVELLNNLGIMSQIKSKAIFAKDVKQVLSWVETGNAHAGFVYLTDAKFNKNVKMVKNISIKSYSPIVYPGALIKKSGNNQNALEFMDYLKTEKAKNIFIKYGFTYLADSK